MHNFVDEIEQHLLRSTLCANAFAPCASGGQFHQHSIRNFYVHEFRAQFFCAYILGLYFTGARLLEQKLGVEC